MEAEKLERKAKLENLPDSNDAEFWGEAEVATHTLAESVKCDHSFIHRTAREIECRNCHIGFFLGIGDEVKGKHVYVKGVLAV